MAIVYQHRRKDDGSIFYIGIGKDRKRAFSTKGRTKYWSNIYNSCGFDVDVLFEGIDWQDACLVEIGMIQSYGRKDLGLGELVNMTNGGEGANGSVRSKETRKKISDSSLGKKMSEDSKLKMSEAKKGNKYWLGKKHNNETLLKLSKVAKGRISYNSKKVIDITTNNIYDNALVVSKMININYKTLTQWLRGERKNKTNFKYL